MMAGVWGRACERYEPWLFAAALVVTAGVCLLFRYLPMVDLPQHYAMVSVFVHHSDPVYGFADRFFFDLAHRPYASVYLAAAALAKVVPLAVAMRVVVAVCTVLPIIGLRALLAATGRPRHLALIAVPFAFGSLWAWGFLNFLASTGLLLVALSLVCRLARTHEQRTAIGLGLLSLLILVTHVHGMFMLIALAPVLAWGFRGEEPAWRAVLRVGLPIIPAAAGTFAFVIVTWSQAVGSWVSLDLSFVDRIRAFPDFLAAGIPAPWPGIACAVLVAAIVLSIVFRDRESTASRRQWIALAIAFAGQLLLYFVLPLNTPTATYVCARHALLIVLFGLPLLPAVRAGAVRIAIAGAFAVAGLVLAIVEVSRFDHEARSFDPILEAMKPNKRVAPLIFEKGSPYVHPRAFPYLHFAAYYQAASGGDLARSFAVVWNVPVRYRADYLRHEVPEDAEWDPRRFSPTRDLPYFDYLVIRGADFTPRAETGLVVVARSGPWTLIENPSALPAR
ncbi:hypothetical protein BH11MYX3_BH11MYX3_35890 [soil metagenome]